MLRVLVFIFVMAMTLSANADSLQFRYPDHNVSSRDIIEFRGRIGVPGHAYVLLGKELDNGLKDFYMAAGAYPEEGTNILQTFKFVMHGPGRVDYTMADLDNDVVYTAFITDGQRQDVLRIVEEWKHNNYGLATQNCVTLTRVIARSLGLKDDQSSAGPVTPEGILIDAVLPQYYIQSLKEHNQKNAAIEFAAQTDALNEQIQREILEAQKKQAEEEYQAYLAFLTKYLQTLSAVETGEAQQQAAMDAWIKQFHKTPDFILSIISETEAKIAELDVLTPEISLQDMLAETSARLKQIEDYRKLTPPPAEWKPEPGPVEIEIDLSNNGSSSSGDPSVSDDTGGSSGGKPGGQSIP